MTKKSKNSISLADILVLIGLSSIGVFTFYGTLLNSTDGKPGKAIIWAVVQVATLGVLLYGSIRCKQKTSDSDKWNILGWVLIAGYLVTAGLSASSFNRFFYIVSQKDELQAQARTEINAIKELYRSYEYQQNKFLENAVEQLQNYQASEQKLYIKDALAEYTDKFVSDSIKSWEDKAKAVVKMPKDKELEKLEQRVENWDLLDLSVLARDLKEKDTKAWKDLNEKIMKYGEKNQLIPVISGGGTSRYYLDGFAQFDLGEPVKAQFASNLQQATGSTASGWIIYLLLNVCILLKYAVTIDTGSPLIRKNHTGGIDL